MEPDRLKMVRTRKVVDNGTGPFAIPLAQLTESIITNDKLDQLLAKEAPEMPEYPEIEMPEYPTEITVANLPDIQKVEITNLPKDKDDKEQLKLLKQIAEELKKKEQYAYDIEVDSDLKSQLKGEPGQPGKDGVEITPDQVRDKLEELQGDERLDASAIKGLDAFVKETTQTKVYGTRLLRNLADITNANEATTGQVLTKRSDGTFNFSTPPGGSGTDSFETVSKNLSASNATPSYTSGLLTSINYANGITKTLSYTSGAVTSITLSGATPLGIDLTKTITYSGGVITGIAYS